MTAWRIAMALAFLFVSAEAINAKPLKKKTKASLSGKPPGCPSMWCGCWLSKYLGYNDRKLWLARNWLKVGRPAHGPAPGVIAVFARGKGGHVGVVTTVKSPNKIVLLSGNDGGAVRERERSTAQVIAYRWP